jgi:hypothetical protein
VILIRDEQQRVLAQGVEQLWKKEYADRLRVDFPQKTASILPEDFRAIIDDGWTNAMELEITEQEDIYRFLKLRFLPREILESDFIQSVLIRVLNNMNLSGTKRLDFVEEQVIKPRMPDSV